MLMLKNNQYKKVKNLHNNNCKLNNLIKNKYCQLIFLLRSWKIKRIDGKAYCSMFLNYNKINLNKICHKFS